MTQSRGPYSLLHGPANPCDRRCQRFNTQPLNKDDEEDAKDGEPVQKKAKKEKKAKLKKKQVGDVMWHIREPEEEEGPWAIGQSHIPPREPPAPALALDTGL